ncbi:MAG: hypothetical protein HYY01_10135 [Chloroflexi bacterium]|nr:hypothetical protein [Chloroflexota bacterium]
MLVAARVVVEAAPPAEATPTLTPTPAPRPSPGPTPSPTPTTVVVSGRLGQDAAGRYVVDGKVVALDPLTQLVGKLEVGAEVRVEGVAQADGTVLATRIEVLASTPTSPTPTPSLAAPVPTPTPTLAPTPTPTPPVTVLIGTLTSISPGLWTVNGVQVLLNASTVIEGLPLVGLRVRVEGTIQPDGTIVATRITVLP